ncbi:uncharacterized protein LOC129901584 isoform X2 [Solanum dulcamara]|uniref:uncharacterized protein LOC129901584 isoform X2 n=1 Tax=Solanum dulcamara TaxID=45834 RepID=UPI002485C4D8|nr:uncharacterized protein LOC129901584 isoform X2 [Solanum dulcamara]
MTSLSSLRFITLKYATPNCLKQDVTALKEPQLLPLVEKTAQGKSIVVQPADQTVNRSGDSAALVTSFEVVIKASHLNRARSNFPAAFGNSYLKRTQRPLVATLRTGSGSWTIVPQYYDRLELGEGMQKFIDDNALRVNDVCRFKLIDDEKLILKVRIIW